MTSESRVGEVLASKYRLEELLGSGGMGHVYRAVNQDVGRAVAIKVLRGEHAQNAEVVERFLREARAANLVRHPNVVDVIDIGREAGGAPFIVQELLEGEDLAHLAERRGGRLPLEEVVDILGPVIDAVAEAHARGVIHRDIKPENVFLAKGPRGPIPKLLDFGISKVRAHDLRATDVGVMMGTPAYMPPEQVQGARDADARSDVWALGVMLFELLAGRMPFDAPNAPALFFAIATTDAPTLLDVEADVPAEVSRVVARCLRRRPDERYPTAAELARDLRHVVEGTELEPTGKRSIPPSLAALVPDLAIPIGPLAPTMSSTATGGNRAPRAAKAVPVVVSVARGAISSEQPNLEAAAPSDDPPASLPAAPSLAPPAPRVPDAAALAPPPGAAPAPALELGQMHAAPSARLAAPRSPPAQAPDLGQMHAAPRARLPAAATMARPASHAARGPEQTAGADTSSLIGAAVVSLVVILGVGLLKQLAHRPEGWPVARFVLQPGPTVEIVLQGFLALVVSAIGATYWRRGVRHWGGELAGGPPGAILNAVIAAAAFFSAFELVCAVT